MFGSGERLKRKLRVQLQQPVSCAHISVLEEKAMLSCQVVCESNQNDRLWQSALQNDRERG